MVRERNGFERGTDSSGNGPPPGDIKVLQIKWGDGVEILLFADCLGELKRVISIGEFLSTIRVKRLLFGMSESDDERESGSRVFWARKDGVAPDVSS
jgi:hypothetical protein